MFLGAYTVQHAQFDYTFCLIETAVIDVLSVLLFCYFIPSSKKYAGLFCVIVPLLFLVYKYFVGRLFIKYDTKEFLTAFVHLPALFAGFYLSYLLFKNKGWGSSKAKKMQPD
jgi:hypothetical protein